MLPCSRSSALFPWFSPATLAHLANSYRGWHPRSRLAGQPRLAAALRQLAHPEDIGGALGHADDAARVQEIEHMAGLDALVVGRQREAAIEQRRTLVLGIR